MNITAFGTFFDYEEIPFLTLTDLVADERDVYVQAKLDIYSTGGELYGAPSQLGGTVVYYNTDITEAADVDIDSIVTWDDYVAAGKQVLEKTGKHDRDRDHRYGALPGHGTAEGLRLPGRGRQCDSGL